MKIAAIIPDRGDRPELTAFCLKQLESMTVKPDFIFQIDYVPTGASAYDLASRVEEGVKQAREAGADWCFIIENDDAYPVDYFARYMPYLYDFDFVGDTSTVYYNIRTRKHQTLYHPKHSSLFTTAFRTIALDDFKWPEDVDPRSRFLDIPLWKYAANKRRAFIVSGAIGIKHGIGKCGGVGHYMNLANEDLDLTYLKSKLTPEHISFYHKYHTT
jgi:hypothetical protein